MGCVILSCPDCGYASAPSTPRPRRECPACGAQMVREFDEDGDHDEEPEREEED